MRRLTKEQAQKIEHEMNALNSDAQKQLREWKDAMIRAANEVANRDKGSSNDILILRTHLVEWIEQIQVKLVTIKEGEAVVSYDFPDELVEWIEAQHPELVIPGVLLNCLDGSTQVEAKPVVVPVQS